MSNDYYSVSGAPSTGAALDSAVIRAEFLAISAGFDKLPDLTSIANRIVHANAGSTALTTTSGFTFDGTTLTTPGLSVTDSTFSIKDNSDATKVAQFQCSGITTATTRTYALPDTTGTLVVSDGSNAFGVAKYAADAVGAELTGKKSRNATPGSHTIVQINDDILSITAYGSNGTSFDPCAQILFEIDGVPGASADMPGRILFSTTSNGSATLTERARVDNTGKWIFTLPAPGGSAYTGVVFAPSGSTTSSGASVGTNAIVAGDTGRATLDVRNIHASGPEGLYILFTAAAPDDNTAKFLNCQDSSAIRCIIYSDGDLQNHDNSYGAISDGRLKRDVVAAGSQWADVKALAAAMKKYRFKADVEEGRDHLQLGLISQEVAEISPGLVTYNEKDDVYGIQYSVLYLKAVKALGEAMERIEALEVAR